MAADARAVVGDDADDPIEAIAAARHLAHEECGLVARADEEHGDRDMALTLQHMIEAAILDDAIDEARAAQERHQHQPIDADERTRQPLQPIDDEHQREEHQHDERHGAQHAEEIGQGGVAPDAAIEAGPPEDAGRHRDEHGFVAEKQHRRKLEDAVADAQLEREDERQRGHEHIMAEGRRRSAHTRHDRALTMPPTLGKAIRGGNRKCVRPSQKKIAGIALRSLCSTCDRMP